MKNQELLTKQDLHEVPFNEYKELPDKTGYTEADGDFNPDGFRATLHRLMGKGNWSLYSYNAIREAIALMGFKEFDASFAMDSVGTVLRCKGVKYGELSGNDAYIDFPNILPNANGYVTGVSFIADGITYKPLAVTNGKWTLDSAMNGEGTCDAVVTLSPKSPNGIIMDFNVNSDGEDARWLESWVKDNIPFAKDANNNAAFFQYLTADLFFTPVTKSYDISYTTNSPFQLTCEETDGSECNVLVNGERGDEVYNFVPGDKITISYDGSADSFPPNGVIYAIIGTQRFPLEYSYGTPTIECDVDELEFPYDKTSKTIKVTSDYKFYAKVKLATDKDWLEVDSTVYTPGDKNWVNLNVYTKSSPSSSEDREGDIEIHYYDETGADTLFKTIHITQTSTLFEVKVGPVCHAVVNAKCSYRGVSGWVNLFVAGLAARCDKMHYYSITRYTQVIPKFMNLEHQTEWLVDRPLIVGDLKRGTTLDFTSAFTGVADEYNNVTVEPFKFGLNFKATEEEGEDPVPLEGTFNLVFPYHKEGEDLTYEEVGGPRDYDAFELNNGGQTSFQIEITQYDLDKEPTGYVYSAEVNLDVMTNPPSSSRWNEFSTEALMEEGKLWYTNFSGYH